jgi:murein L,D-transpeptidase YafK
MKKPHNRTCFLLSASLVLAGILPGSYCKKPEHSAYTKRYSIRIDKKERLLFLLENRIAIRKAYKVVFGKHFEREKEREGDIATPEGTFFICEIVLNPGGRYGSRAFMINDPSRKDAERGYSRGLISRALFMRISVAARPRMT